MKALFFQNVKRTLCASVWGMLFCVFFCPGHVDAFWGNPVLERSERKFDIEILPSQKIQVTLSEKVKNPSELDQVLQVFFPLPEGISDIQFFRNLEGEKFSLLEGNEKLSALADAAQKFQNSRFFRLGDPKYSQILRSEEITIPARGEQSLKLVFSLPITTVGDFQSFEIFTNDGITDGLFETAIALPSSQSVPHFFTNLPAGAFVDNSFGVTYFFHGSSFVPQQNLRVYWSEKSSATARYPFGTFTYVGHFLPNPSLRDIEEVTFLIDQSGSMSGDLWYRVRDLLPFFLENLPTGKRIRVGFFDQEVHFLSDGFESNSTELRKKVLDKISTIQPMGKTDLSKAFEKISDGWTVDSAKRMTFLITDKDEFVSLEKVSSPVIIFSFQDTSTPLQTLAEANLGFYQKLFRTASSTVETREFLRKWNTLRSPLNRDEIVPELGEGEILPAVISNFFDDAPLFFTGRLEGNLTDLVPAFDMLPRAWGEQKIAEILTRHITDREFSDEELDALLAIGRTFGIETRFFGHLTTRDELQKSLSDATVTEDIYRREILNLQESYGFSLPLRAQFLGAKPFYPDKNNAWQSFDFLEKLKADTWLKVAPFSSAQRELFLQFPDILAEIFGMGTEVESCAEFRCISVRWGYSSDTAPGDRAFWRGFDRSHWANEYLIPLVNQGVYIPADDGHLFPDQPITRGEFLQMLFGLKNGSNPLPAVENPVTFPDVPSDSKFLPAIQYFFNQKVVKGYDDGLFRPSQVLTRAEAVKILLAANKIVPPTLEKLQKLSPIFSDSLDWERPWVEEASKRGIISGFEEGEQKNFRPRQSMTRAEAAKILVKGVK